ncbi:MAG: flagellar type III secretion system pore protein FliP [Gemmatimonadaceae bacterium]
MTFGSIMGVLLTLGFVLALLGVALRLLRRFAPTSTTGSRLRMEVVQRLALGPKQGIAVIRVGERFVAVSVGDGGIRRLFELEEGEVAASVSAGIGKSGSARPTSPLDFGTALRGALKTAGLSVVLAASLSVAPHALHAQPSPGAARTAVSAVANSVTKSPNGTKTTASKVTNPAPAPATAPAPSMDIRLGGGNGSEGLHLSGTVGVVVMMGLLTLLPMLLLMMTGFTRILIVLNFLRQALGTQSAPPTQLVAGLALLLTGFVMAPTLNEVNRTAIAPWMDGKMDQATMLDVGSKPFRAFMLRQTRRQDIETFVRISGGPRPETVNDVPLVTLTSAYVISELRTAFQIGFALFLPFIVIDVAVSSVLMSMGMFMLPPAMISLPFKLLLFVLVDGWNLIVQSLVTSFR